MVSETELHLPVGVDANGYAEKIIWKTPKELNSLLNT